MKTTLKFRNAYSTHAKMRRAGAMKDRRAPRGGTTNEQRDLLEECEVEEACETCGSAYCGAEEIY